MNNTAKVYLRRICVVRLGAVGGIKTETAKKAFELGFDYSFENEGIVFSGISLETDMVIDEPTSNGRFQDFLGNTAEELERWRMFGSQFAEFCLSYPDKLRKNSHGATFFLLTRKDEPVAVDLSNVFVARVGVGFGQLGAGLHYFAHDQAVWNVKYKHRIVSPATT
ncbi:MAG: hypothetical protein V1484_01245 [bacterium]